MLHTVKITRSVSEETPKKMLPVASYVPEHIKAAIVADAQNASGTPCQIVRAILVNHYATKRRAAA